MADEPTHYERIGGIEAIRHAVNDFYDRVLSDPELGGYFTGVDIGRVKRHQVRLLSSVLGGPQVYDGRALGAAHTGLKISPEHYDRVVAHLAAVLTARGAPADTTAAVLDAMHSVKAEIVEASARE
jgi:hemoglobin